MSATGFAYKKVIKPLLFRLSPETAHAQVVRGLSLDDPLPDTVLGGLDGALIRDQRYFASSRECAKIRTLIRSSLWQKWFQQMIVSLKS